MLNKKLSGLFLRKQTKKEQSKQVQYFDENYFLCRLVSRGLNTELIRVQAQLKDGGQALDEIRCKWFIKNSHDFRQIEDVVSSYYQPCLDDVGSIICVQIEPFIEGKQYNGITIMKESEVIRLDEQIEKKLQLFLVEGLVHIDGHVEAVFSQNQKYEGLELPLEVRLEVSVSKIVIMCGGQALERVLISQEYPNIEFIRKSFSSIVFNFNARESMKLSFNNNTNRDLFALIVRTCVAQAVNPQQGKKSGQLTENTRIEEGQVQKQQKAQGRIHVQQEEKRSVQINLKEATPKRNSVQQTVAVTQQLTHVEKTEAEISKECQSPTHKSNSKIEEKQSNTLLVLKLDQQSRQLKAIKRRYDQLEVNYKLEKSSKLSYETEIEALKKELKQLRKEHEETTVIARKVKQLSEDNRFYKNEISITKKELKVSQERVAQLQNELKSAAVQSAVQHQRQMNELKAERDEMKLMRFEAQCLREGVEGELQRVRGEMQRVQNQNAKLRKKLQSLMSERSIVPPVVQSRVVSEKQGGEDGRVRELQMKLKNLQMLLRYKSGQGEVSSSFQMLVNNLTETISEKQLQLNEVKKINKSLLQQLRAANKQNN